MQEGVDYGGVMPDNNVAETARSPQNLAWLSVRSHQNDVTRGHMCRQDARGKKYNEATQRRKLELI